MKKFAMGDREKGTVSNAQQYKSLQGRYFEGKLDDCNDDDAAFADINSFVFHGKVVHDPYNVICFYEKYYNKWYIKPNGFISIKEKSGSVNKGKYKVLMRRVRVCIAISTIGFEQYEEI